MTARRSPRKADPHPIGLWDLPKVTQEDGDEYWERRRMGDPMPPEEIARRVLAHLNSRPCSGSKLVDLVDLELTEKEFETVFRILRRRGETLIGGRR